MSVRRDPQTDSLRLHAYGMLADFWLELGTKDEMSEDEAILLPKLQQGLIEEFGRRLLPYCSADEIKSFRDYVDKFKVRIMFLPNKTKVHFQR